MRDMKNATHIVLFKPFAIVIAAIGLSMGSAQALSYDTSGATIVEDFDLGLPSGAATPTWTDNSVFPSWYAYQSATSAAPTNYRITSSGNSTQAQLYQYRPSAGSTNGALGTRPSGTTGDMMTGVQITNNTGTTLTSFSLSYTGEQWFESATAQNNQLIVAYQFGSPANLSDGVWTNITDLTFNSPQNSGADITLDGTLPANQEVLSTSTIGSINWASGTDLWLRWFDANSSGFDQALAIDDVTFSAVPEPSTYALIASVGILAVVALKRRRFQLRSK